MSSHRVNKCVDIEIDFVDYEYDILEYIDNNKDEPEIIEALEEMGFQRTEGSAAGVAKILSAVEYQNLDKDEAIAQIKELIDYKSEKYS